MTTDQQRAALDKGMAHAKRRMTKANTEHLAASKEQREVIAAALDSGLYTKAQVARALGVGSARIGQIEKARATA